MLIILEGPDGGGKTTLAEFLSEHLGLKHIRSEGPQKYPGEIDHRIKRYLDMDTNRLIFDRHPCVSQLAYRMVHDQDVPDAALINRFYEQDPLFIYCRPLPNAIHTASGAWDTAEYLAAVDANYSKLMEWYDLWAARHASIIYRIGDNMHAIAQMALIRRNTL